jgi:hypothetical protein
VEKYFPVGTSRDDRGFILGARASIALRILDHFAIIAATDDGEDSRGRAKLKLNDPESLVYRAFSLADAFVRRAEERGEIVKADFEAVAREIGRLHGITEDEKYHHLGFQKRDTGGQ